MVLDDKMVLVVLVDDDDDDNAGEEGYDAGNDLPMTKIFLEEVANAIDGDASLLEPTQTTTSSTSRRSRR